MRRQGRAVRKANSILHNSEIPELPTNFTFTDTSMAASNNTTNTTATLSLKLLVDTKGSKVLFAEAGKDFVDFLFTLLTLPCGTVISLLANERMVVGSLSNIYDSIANFSDTYMQPNQNKDSILKPAVIPSNAVNVGLLLPNVEALIPKKLYRCDYCNSSSYADDPNTTCPSCRNRMSYEMSYVAPPTVGNDASSTSKEVGFVKGVVTYMVMDDLVVQPMSTISSIAMLNKLNVKDVGALEEKVVHLATNEVINLLKSAFQSQTVLTDMFLRKEEGQ